MKTKLFGILERTVDIFTRDVDKNDLLLPLIYNDALKYIDMVKTMMGMNGISNDQIENFFDIHGSNNLFAGENPLKIYPIRPVSPLGGGPGGLVFDPPKIVQRFKKRSD